MPLEGENKKIQKQICDKQENKTMALSDLKRLSYEISGVLVDCEKGDGFNSTCKKTLEKVMHDLKVLDNQTHSVATGLEHVAEGEVLMYLKFLRSHNSTWSTGCANAMEKLWNNIHKVDKKLKEKN